MSDDYRRVAEALKDGASLDMLCATCPWDRYCITPPTMTREDVEREIERAKEGDREASEKAKAEGKEGSMPMGMLITSIAIGGRDQQASICPVFATRLRSSAGRRIVDAFKTTMTTWDDEALA